MDENRIKRIRREYMESFARFVCGGAEETQAMRDLAKDCWNVNRDATLYFDRLWASEIGIKL